ncbi:hypothetical protein K2D_33730 [Planctomycetes bacterium K2D]|uniref:Uncharacterized protein n=1 Tax=Botrimarina mediterranea TaxID=2528022 RepID=A0A518KBE7_9BACT|nr:hypothetical protein Spa11_33220 [Botrimarina mediterranea]QDV79757.1 hypothetical protein K2D_33730 [Planctomycetes bacterium K2D]
MGNFPNSPDVKGDKGSAARSGFQQDVGHSFGMARQTYNVGRPEPIRQLCMFPWPMKSNFLAYP